MRALTDGSRAVANTNTYDAYGKPLSSTRSVSDPFGYTGEYTDQESGFVYLRARYYDPESQQFLTVDPALAWTEQAYAYAGGSPTNATDPSGYLCVSVGGSISCPDPNRIIVVCQLLGICPPPDPNNRKSQASEASNAWIEPVKGPARSAWGAVCHYFQGWWNFVTFSGKSEEWLKFAAIIQGNYNLYPRDWVSQRTKLMI